MMAGEEKITKKISLTLDQWETVKDALNFYECAAVEFMTYAQRRDFSKEYIKPVYDQMPDEVF